MSWIHIIVQGRKAGCITQTRHSGDLYSVKRREACLLTPVLAALPPAFVYNCSESESVPTWEISDRGGLRDSGSLLSLTCDSSECTSAGHGCHVVHYKWQPWVWPYQSWGEPTEEVGSKFAVEQILQAPSSSSVSWLRERMSSFSTKKCLALLCIPRSNHWLYQKSNITSKKYRWWRARWVSVSQLQGKPTVRALQITGDGTTDTGQSRTSAAKMWELELEIWFKFKAWIYTEWMVPGIYIAYVDKPTQAGSVANPVLLERLAHIHSQSPWASHDFVGGPYLLQTICLIFTGESRG